MQTTNALLAQILQQLRYIFLAIIVLVATVWGNQANAHGAIICESDSKKILLRRTIVLNRKNICPCVKSYKESYSKFDRTALDYLVTCSNGDKYSIFIINGKAKVSKLIKASKEGRLL